MTVIPDTIEPYIGHKALVIENGFLYSPTYQTIWTPGERLKARCKRSPETFGWVKREGPPPMTNRAAVQRGSAHHHGRQLTTTRRTATVFYAPEWERMRPPPPQERLPDGWYWSWEPTIHDAGDPDCTCGIYVARLIREAFHYMRENAVVCKVAVWGQTTIGSQGARGQYAYPQLMYVPDHLAGVAYDVACRYGIKTEPQKFVSGYEPELRPRRLQPTSTRVRQDAKGASYFFSLLSVINIIAAVICLYVGRNWWLTAFAMFVASFTLLVASIAREDSKR